MFPLNLRAWSLFTAILMSLVLLASACGGGARPTITTDRLEDAGADTSEEVAEAETFASGADDIEEAAEASAEPVNPGDPRQLVVQVLESFPHDSNAFTQGLELDNGTFIESTGLSGESDLRRVDPATGEVTLQVATPNDFFAEGVTKVGDELIQLTWTENTAFFWDAASFELKKEVAYEGQGWGLCYDGSQLVMTDGTSSMIFRDPTTFEELSRITVTLQGDPISNLNELECVNGEVWANVWQTDEILRINPTTGEVTAVVDASSLQAGTRAGGAVLNGIAWDQTTESFYVTGKLWPTMYRVEFVPA